MTDREKIVALQRIEVDLAMTAESIAQAKELLKQQKDHFDALVDQMRELVRKDANQSELFDNGTGELRAAEDPAASEETGRAKDAGGKVHKLKNDQERPN